MDYLTTWNEQPAQVFVSPPRKGEIFAVGEKKYRIIGWRPPTIDEATPRLNGGDVPTSFGGSIIVEEVQ